MELIICYNNKPELFPKQSGGDKYEITWNKNINATQEVGINGDTGVTIMPYINRRKKCI